MEGRKLCPCRESPIVSPGLSHSEKVVESRCFWGSFCSLSYLDIGRRGRKKTTSMDEEATLPRPFFFLLSAFAYAEKSDQTNTMLFLPIPLFRKHLTPTHPFQGSPPDPIIFCLSALLFCACVRRGRKSAWKHEHNGPRFLSSARGGGGSVRMSSLPFVPFDPHEYDTAQRKKIRRMSVVSEYITKS